MPGQTNTERGRVARARLLAAARELIGELGWSAVSTRVLAERAGVPPGLVHYHFKSLQALLCHAALEEMRQVLDGITAILTQATSPADGIETILFDLDQHNGSDPASLLFIETYLAATRDRELRQQMSALVADFRGSLTDVLTRSGHPSPQDAASAVMAVFDGFVLHKGLDPDLSAARIAPLLRRITTTEENGEHR
ncbi:TetR family transcriptional regulator [Micromonospora sp. ATCC 39149]|uniref:TetR/AcrR family transcriptional regulator n=1 Tax=Micromonospora carbonacea TaxID=47853 RepID=A0A7D5YFX4_9ACTN|nr:TetR/AcrR family transcriptional regulator [Micromonospora sp. ATCC 39149]EEP72309.1 TetR family transcriptional regulator [Micromonospora sp. ATCC 39149]QLJ98476.1 TetR/AcrR family transcriptional regulator [Micromonospora carbonacea]